MNSAVDLVPGTSHVADCEAIKSFAGKSQSVSVANDSEVGDCGGEDDGWLGDSAVVAGGWDVNGGCSVRGAGGEFGCSSSSEVDRGGTGELGLELAGLGDLGVVG